MPAFRIDIFDEKNDTAPARTIEVEADSADDLALKIADAMKPNEKRADTEAFAFGQTPFGEATFGGGSADPDKK